MYTGRTGGWKRVVYSPGCGGYYLNRNRNSRSVLGIDYTIARAQAAHMNQIKDRPEDFLPQRGGGEGEGGGGGERRKRGRERKRLSSLISSTYENKSNLCIYMCSAHVRGECIARMTYCRLDDRETAGTNWKPRGRGCMPLLRFTKSGTTPRSRLSESRN